MLKLHPTADGLLIESGGRFHRPLRPLHWDDVFTEANPASFLRSCVEGSEVVDAGPDSPASLVQSQEVWAAGVTYWRSRTARMTEAKDAGGGTFYDKVYSAERPELFFKSTAHRVVAPGGAVRIRADSRWNVPEPELTLAINAAGKIFGYTVGNDMSSRDIEGENPLYLPQAKVYDGSAALGPCVLVAETPLAGETAIELEISRDGAAVFTGSTMLHQIKRPLESLVQYLFRDQSYPKGCYLMTGTGIVPPDDFTLRSGDRIAITIAPIGTLVNTVA